MDMRRMMEIWLDRVVGSRQRVEKMGSRASDYCVAIEDRIGVKDRQGQTCFVKSRVSVSRLSAEAGFEGDNGRAVKGGWLEIFQLLPLDMAQCLAAEQKPTKLFPVEVIKNQRHMRHSPWINRTGL